MPKKSNRPNGITQDDLIWNNGIDHFIEINDFDSSETTKLPKGTELTVYSDDEQITKSFWFASSTGKWIKYEKPTEN